MAALNASHTSADVTRPLGRTAARSETWAGKRADDGTSGWRQLNQCPSCSPLRGEFATLTAPRTTPHGPRSRRSTADNAAVVDEIKAIEVDQQVHTAIYPGEYKGKEDSHVPKVELVDDKATIEVAHEMKEEHWIKYIWLNDELGNIIRAVKLAHTDSPMLHAKLPDGVKAVVASAFCNVHGLWRSETHPVALKTK